MNQTEKTFPAGSILFSEGDAGGDIYIIKSGEAKVFLEREGQEFQLALLSKGELLGAVTASTQTSRSASARALSELTVTVVENKDLEKLLKNMPLWASILIKDLVFRLKFMNELYVLSMTQDSTILQRSQPLRSAVRLAKGILANAKANQIHHEDAEYINLNTAVAPLLDIFLKEKATFQRIYSLFLGSSLLELKELSTPGTFLSKTELHGLQIFIEIANVYLNSSDTTDTPAIPNTASRSALLDLSNWAKSININEGIDVVTVDMAQVEDRLVIAKTKRNLVFPLITTAQVHRMLTINKESGTISIYPDRMRQIIASMNIVKALEDDSITDI